ncbi:glycoside hydrolase family 18 protein [Heterostelium album PN500]|uniref:Fucosyltransferase n=1 Tax=Heterostelium pallidum (strain ATCC 26659 / Pp 5 / PN500) TaxID=670386 RepID=D3BQJ5_HETP5|nr:glycoside hydrolase family 18 protein [Heterostelium album PN500]EFA76415.1 glycoside hydrolase family 18 protein [Heterostelium album PN500]|eukprot:XP_020428547.1 glycoside hydrolase family 18 protein [Heterostelium album PN500]
MLINVGGNKRSYSLNNKRILFLVLFLIVFLFISVGVFVRYGEIWRMYSIETQQVEINLYNSVVKEKRTLFVLGSTEWGERSDLEATYSCGREDGSVTTEWTHDKSRLAEASGVLYFGSDISKPGHFNPIPLASDSMVRVYMNLESLGSEFSGCLKRESCYSYFNWTIGAIDGFNDIVIKYFSKSQFEEFYTAEVANPFDAKKLLEKKRLYPENVVAWMCSQCENFTVYGFPPTDRGNFMERFMKHIHVDSYGTCLNNKQLPAGGHRKEDNAQAIKLDLISKYKFYMALENHNCFGYISEKVFQCLVSGVVPVYMGHDSTFDLLPPGSFINGKAFNSTKSLADYLTYLNNNDEEYLKYFKWREDLQAAGCCKGEKDKRLNRKYYPVPKSFEDIPKQPIPCPCEDVSLCQPLSIPFPREEFLGFAVTAADYTIYDWEHLTTIVLFEEPDPQMICIAHKNNVRLSIGSEFPFDHLGDGNFTQQWIQGYIQVLKNNYYDGINFVNMFINQDFEYVISENQSILSGLYTGVVAQTTFEMKKVNPFYQISVDVPFSPSCIYDRCYDYFGIAQASDILLVMDYDMNLSPDLAQANSPLPNVASGLTNYTDLLIPREKIVMAFPWYGYDYQCINNMTLQQTECIIDPDGTLQRYFFDINEIMMNQSLQSTGELWNDPTSSPFFNYFNSTTNSVHQVWYDNAESIALKVQYSRKLGVGGVGVWTIDYVSPSTQPSLSQMMWDAMNSFFQ